MKEPTENGHKGFAHAAPCVYSRDRAEGKTELLEDTVAFRSADEDEEQVESLPIQRNDAIRVFDVLLWKGGVNAQDEFVPLKDKCSSVKGLVAQTFSWGSRGIEPIRSIVVDRADFITLEDTEPFCEERLV